MIEQDYVMRMIQSFTTVLARVLFLRRARDFPQMQVEIDEFSRRALGIDKTMADRLSEEQLIEFIRSDDRLAGVKCYVMGMLFREEAEMRRDQGMSDEAAVLEAKSLSILLESCIALEFKEVADLEQTIRESISRLTGYQLPLNLLRKIMLFHEHDGRFDAAEDVLYDALAIDPGCASDGIALYKRLLKLPDRALIQGGLPRDEVEDGLAQLTPQ